MSRFKVKDNNDQWVDISANGVGVPSGGNQGQILAKRSGTSYDAGWVNPSGGVHVGPTAPSDAFTTIWLDTDEQGASSVSSVNGKNGTVVLDADDVGAMSKWELLWTNASSSSSFAAQTVSIDLSEYDFVVIETSLDNTDSLNKGNIFLCRVGYTCFLQQTPSASTAEYTRECAVSSAGITFGSGYFNTGANNIVSRPTRIYGIKGVA